MFFCVFFYLLSFLHCIKYKYIQTFKIMLHLLMIFQGFFIMNILSFYHHNRSDYDYHLFSMNSTIFLLVSCYYYSYYFTSEILHLNWGCFYFVSFLSQFTFKTQIFSFILILFILCCRILF